MAESPNIRTLIMLNGPLCFAYEDCGHRTLISGHQLASRRLLQGTMSAISCLRLRCGECGSRRIQKVIPRDMAEAGRFVAGDLLKIGLC